MYTFVYRCRVLDESLGDTRTNIINHERSIALALSSSILEKSSVILKAAHLMSQLDVLLALATVSRDNAWSKPTVIENGPFEIEDGRHPLQELCVEAFIPNDTKLSSYSKKVRY